MNSNKINELKNLKEQNQNEVNKSKTVSFNVKSNEFNEMDDKNNLSKYNSFIHRRKSKENIF